MDVVLDTSVFVDYLRGSRKAKEVIDKIQGRELGVHVSALTEAELLAGKECEEEEKREEIGALISLCNKEHVNNQISQKAGEFRRKYGVSLADCVIAATAFTLKSKVWTKNVKELSRIKDVRVEEPY